MIQTTKNLTTEQKVGQLFTIGIPGPEIDSETEDLLDEISPGGICLFARNIREAGQTRELTDHLRTALPVLPIIAVDQEGGLVDRLRRLMAPMPSASTIKTPAEARFLGEVVADALLMLGINMDLAPVVDVVTASRGQYSNGLTSRIFGSNPKETTELAREFLEALQGNGVVGCLKHFPGLGASQVDSHEELPVVDIPEEEFRSTDLFPYLELLATGNVHAVMVAHAAFQAASLQETGQNGKLLPSSLSYNFVTRLLRSELQFDGLVITDDLEMGAIRNNYGVGDACKMAVSAGIDQLAVCADPQAIREGYRGVLAAVKGGEISIERLEVSLKRIETLKSRLQEPLPYDRSRLAGLSARIADLTERSNRS